MIYSDERIRHLSHQIWEQLKTKACRFDKPEAALALIKDTFHKYIHRADEIDQKVKAKIASMKRHINPGTPEWEVLYQKYFAEEAIRHGFA